MSRLHANAVSGTLSSSLSSSGTTMSAAALALLPAVTAPDIAAITLDPLGTAGLPEVVWVTSHAGAATTATITRAAETGDGLNAVGRAHTAPVAWVHSITKTDHDFVGKTIGLTVSTTALSPAFTASTSIADVDATNLAVTFTVPVSGKVLVRFTGVGWMETAGVAYWGIQEGGSTIGTPSIVTVDEDAQVLVWIAYVTGLAPGASKTYKWGWKVSAGQHTLRIGTGADAGPAVMEVIAA